MRLIGLSTLLATALLSSACSRGADEDAGAASIAAGQALFEQNCAGCHPRSGRGDYLKRLPVTLLARRSESELKTWIIGKGQHREMPSFEQLDTEQLQSLADFLKSEIGR